MDRHSFCPTELRQPIINLMEQHLNVHPLIPGYAYPSPVGIRCWGRIKKDFLHHFNKPRLDLLVWILVTKLAPNYYRRLDIMLNATSRFWGQPSWRKAFKAQWRCCQNTPTSLPLNPKYRPDPYRWVCTCPYFFKSRFLLCKHLVQAVHPVDPVFFHKVERSRTLPSWSHPAHIPSLPPTGVANVTERQWY
ncbi:hypothetical protein DFH07DRAFT_764395 [Mycena maculata]|uniref:SWIM-type domain-containing protein n=1 Tax=Mycena maculata TaxID=230809 RepID=A0AAD7KBI3_9AGAR|nr:hypothetical protein DFH07DRAFT_764395 [Mycena maculata]